MPDMLLTVDEVADLLHVNVETIYDLAYQHKLRGMKVRGQWRFLDLDVRRWLHTHGTNLPESGSTTTDALHL
jgi:excisionase family DNA binding protein